jgi:uncharacterized protein (TIGR01777 family)
MAFSMEEAPRSGTGSSLKEREMKIFVTGGTGFVGSNLVRKLTEKGHEVTVLTRSAATSPPLPQGANYLEGSPAEKGAWMENVPYHDGIINLAGASIFGRWTEAAKKAIRDSRLLTTRNLVQALAARPSKPPFLFSTSAIGYYGFHQDEELDESSPPGEGFLASLSQEWESAAREAENHGARVVLLRFGIVLERDGGALKQMIPVFEKYLGSPLGSGKQWFSWIHLQDLINVYLFLIDQARISGPINCTSPHPVRNQELTRTLGEALGKPTFMPRVPGFVLRMILGEFGSVLLRGQRVLPRRLLEEGYRFQFPDLKGALASLLT